MSTVRLICTLFILPLLLIASCKKSGSGPLSREKAIDIAAHHLMGTSFDVPPPSRVSFADGKYEVCFTYRVPGGAPNETYVKRVVFDAKTRELLELEILTEDPASCHQNSGEEGRLTPLREEVDVAGQVGDQVLNAMERLGVGPRNANQHPGEKSR